MDEFAVVITTEMARLIERFKARLDGSSPYTLSEYLGERVADALRVAGDEDTLTEDILAALRGVDAQGTAQGGVGDAR